MCIRDRAQVDRIVVVGAIGHVDQAGELVGTESGAKYIQIAGAVAEGHHIAFVCHRLVADGGAAGSASYRLVAKYAAPYPCLLYTSRCV